MGRRRTMNRITKIAMSTSFLSLLLIVVVIVSGVAYPNPLFNYGAGLGIVLLFGSIALFAAGWISDLRTATKQKDWLGIGILLLAAVLFLCSFFIRA